MFKKPKFWFNKEAKMSAPFWILQRVLSCIKERRLPSLFLRFLKGPNFVGKKTISHIIWKIIWKIKIQYFGEFGYELISVIPYAYWLFMNNKLNKTESVSDTHCLYYFSPRHKEVRIDRKDIGLQHFPINNIHISNLDTSQWIPPPYRKIYQNNKFVWNKPSLVISNKHSIEWKGQPTNYISLEVLHQILSLLNDKYQIVYNRPTNKQIVNDNQDILEYDDYVIINKYFPEVTTMLKLHEKNKDLTFNALQLMTYANCNNFISVQGGGSVLASYFGGTNIIYAKKGSELGVNAYQNWYNKFSSCRVIHVDNYEDLISKIAKNYL